MMQVPCTLSAIQKMEAFFIYCIYYWLLGVGCSLTWSKRMKIALDAAKGLAFLHDAERPIIYRDFKTSNILLDEVSHHFSVIHRLAVNYQVHAIYGIFMNRKTVKVP